MAVSIPSFQRISFDEANPQMTGLMRGQEMGSNLLKNRLLAAEAKYAPSVQKANAELKNQEAKYYPVNEYMKTMTSLPAMLAAIFDPKFREQMLGQGKNLLSYATGGSDVPGSNIPGAAQGAVTDHQNSYGNLWDKITGIFNDAKSNVKKFAESNQKSSSSEYYNPPKVSKRADVNSSEYKPIVFDKNNKNKTPGEQKILSVKKAKNGKTYGKAEDGKWYLQ